MNSEFGYLPAGERAFRESEKADAVRRADEEREERFGTLDGVRLPPGPNPAGFFATVCWMCEEGIFVPKGSTQHYCPRCHRIRDEQDRQAARMAAEDDAELRRREERGE